MTEPLAHISHADDIDDALFEDTNDAAIWLRAAEQVSDVFSHLAPTLAALPAYDDAEDDDITSLRDDAQSLVQSYTERMDNEGWENNRKYYTLGHIKTETLIAAAKQEMLDWEDVLNAKALRGTAEDIKNILGAMDDAEIRSDLGNALAWAAEPGDLASGMYHAGNVQTAEAILNAGALPSYNGGDLFLDAVRTGNVDMARVFCRAGVDDPSFTLHYWNSEARSYVQTADARQLLHDMYWEYGRYEVVDQSTLAERKSIKDGGQLRVLFDFAARRVSEIYTSHNNTHAFKTEVSFDDYGPAALRTARAKLAELGGNPPADEAPAGHRGMAKPKLHAPGSR